MQAQSIKEYVTIGYKLRYLLDVSTSHPVFGEKRVMDTIRGLIESCAATGLHVTSRAAVTLYEPMAKGWEAGKSRRHSEGRTLSVSEVATIKDATYQIQTVLLAEAQGVYAFVTRDKRYPADRLMNDMPSLMSPDIFPTLPEVAQYDFRQAGRCIAFELPTAAAFHLMRGTEDVVKFFYRASVSDPISRLMWGPMVEDLRRKMNPAPVVLLNILDNLRSGFRNPTQHPEKVYDIEEAQDLLSLSIDAVNRMIRHLDVQNVD